MAARRFFKIARERNRAAGALAELRATAPALAAQAQALAARERFEEAVEKLDYAVKLRPDSAEYLLAKADLLQCQLRLAEAAAIYHAAARLAPGATRAEENAALCERVAVASADPAQQPRLAHEAHEALEALLAAMTHEGRPAAVLMAVARRLGEENRVALEYWRERLKSLPLPPGRPIEQRLAVREDGLLTLDLSRVPVADLEPLRGMPLGSLQLTGCSAVRSIAPLVGMRLQSLTLDGTAVADLSPLAGMQTLEQLGIASTRVENLAPLRGLPLRQLDCSGIPALDFSALAGLPLETLLLQSAYARDLAFLAGMPLRVLSLKDTPGMRGVHFLAELPSLEVLCLPENFYQLPAPELEALGTLRQHPRLRQLSAEPADGTPPQTTPPAEAFWKAWEPDLRWITALHRAGVHGFLKRFPDGAWEVNLRGQSVRDLSLLAGVRVRSLLLYETPIADLTPVRGFPLETLDIRLSAVTDLSPLRGLPLRELYLWKSKVRDFSPLATLPELEVLDVSESAFADLRLIASRKLRMLRIGNTPISDLTPLAGLPLEKLHCDSLGPVDVRPLVRCPGLRWIVLPERARHVDALRAMPGLERLSHRWGIESEPAQTTAEFWESLPGPWADALRASGIDFTAERLPDRTWKVVIKSPVFRDLAALRDVPVSELVLDGTRVADLSALRKMPLRRLSLAGAPVADLAPLAGLPLTSLSLRDTPVQSLVSLRELPLEDLFTDGCASLADYSPLADMPALRSLTVSFAGKNLHLLRRLPHLQRIGYHCSPPGTSPEHTADEFWHEFDRQRR